MVFFCSSIRLISTGIAERALITPAARRASVNCVTSSGCSKYGLKNENQCGTTSLGTLTKREKSQAVRAARSLPISRAGSRYDGFSGSRKINNGCEGDILGISLVSSVAGFGWDMKDGVLT